jgi:hypothetical protein
MTKFETQNKYVTVTVNIKGDVLVDDYKVQQYITDLQTQITNHIVRGRV